jgi:hypothetical protein
MYNFRFSYAPTLLIVLLLGVTSVFAQDVPEFTMTVDKNPVSTSDRFKLTITVKNSKGQITPPDLSAFNLLGGPSQSSSMNYVNGQMSSVKSFTYYLSPKKEGDVMIQPAILRVGKNEYKTNSINLKVIKGQVQDNDDQVVAQQAKDLIASLSFSKNEAYQGEQIIATYKIYSRFNNLEIVDIDFPQTSGFWKEDVNKEASSWEDELKIINGKQYRVAVIKQEIIFPQKTGKIEIEPFNIRCRVNRSFFNPGSLVEAKSNKTELTIKPLPPGRPESFKGAVGDFKVNVSLDRNEVMVNDAMNLSITVSGTGNLKLMNDISPIFPKEFEVYDPKITDNISLNLGGMTGKRKYEYLIIPRYSGEYQLEPISFAYFDNKSGKYKEVSYILDPIQVLSSGSGDEEQAYMINKEEVRVSEQGIRYIKTEVKRFREIDNYFIDSIGFWTLFTGPGLLFILLVMMNKRADKEEVREAARKKSASKTAIKRLKEAEKLKSGTDKAFYDVLFKSLNDYISDRVGIPVSELTKDRVKEVLHEKNVSEQVINTLIEILNQCEMARYTPVSQSDREAMFTGAKDAIVEMEKI